MVDKDDYLIYALYIDGARKRIDELYNEWYLMSNPQMFYKGLQGWGIRQVVK